MGTEYGRECLSKDLRSKGLKTLVKTFKKERKIKAKILRVGGWGQA